MIGSVDAVASRPASSAMSAGAVAAHVVDVEVDQVRAVAGLLAGDRDAVLPVARRASPRGTPCEPLALVRSPTMSTEVSCRNGTGAYSELTPGSGRGWRSRRRDRSGIASRPASRCARGWCRSSRRPARSPYSRTNAASASASSSGVSGYTAPFGPELRQPGVRHHRQRDARVLGQRAQVLAHLGGPGGAVQPDEVDAQRLQRGQRGADLAAEQHRAGGLHRRPARRSGRGGPRRPSPGATPRIAALACSRSWQVSTTSASLPPAISPRPHSA